MQNKFVMLFMVVGLLVANSASAQQATASEIYYPGSVWTSNGTLSPIEKGNTISMTHAEQGIAFRGAEAYGLITGQTDSKGYDWNRRVITGVGVRFTQTISKYGMVRVGMAFLSEQRFVIPMRTNGLSLSADAWFGWRQKPTMEIK